MGAVRTGLNGFVAPDHPIDGRLLFDLKVPASLAWARTHTVEIGDARALQAAAASEAEQFARHGFALLSHRTAVTDWDVPPGVAPADSEVGRVYYPEIETLVGRLLPGRKVMVRQFAPPLRRGRDTASPAYGSGVHQDFGLTVDDYAEALGCYASPEAVGYWRSGWARDGVEGFMVIDFWRTTNMGEPLRHMPLALCEPASVDLADLVPTGMLNFAPSGKPTNNLGLRHQPGQRWWFFPDMVEDEVLAFKLFEACKDEATPRMRSCPHAAFEHPDTPEDARPRQSCEHRVSVWLLKD
jgi:hypothetical protein